MTFAACVPRPRARVSPPCCPCALTAIVATVTAAINANTRAVVVMVSTSPLVSLVAFGNAARHVNDDRVAFPVLHQLVLAQVAEEGLLDQLLAAKIHKQRVVVELAVEHHLHRPRT